MREIRFRAWNGQNMTDEIAVAGNGHITTWDKEALLVPRLQSVVWPVMQYTGLKDKNGKDIYEGDLIKTKNYNYQHTDNIVYQIGYSTTNMMFCLEEKVGKDSIRCNDIYGFHSLEIIGNIYEHPHLLK